MATLVLGPMQRHADQTRVSVWVETDAACEVAVRAVPGGDGSTSGGGQPSGPFGRSRTFAVAGHHYAVVVVEGLSPGVRVPYEVSLDGDRVWPLPGEPASLLCPVSSNGRRLRVVFGSCRVTAPQEPPYTLTPRVDARGLGTDALHALALRMRSGTWPAHGGASSGSGGASGEAPGDASGGMVAEDGPAWPDVLLFLGDQVYADHVSSAALAWLRSRRDTTVPPGREIANFEEYTRLYREAWSQPVIRWLLSTVPTAMIFDDHDVRDDWNISAAWRASIRRQPWWDERITGGIVAYWLYQHLGNLDPDTRAADEVFTELTRLAGEQTHEQADEQAVEHADGSGSGSGSVPESGGAAPGVAEDAGLELLSLLARRADAAADGLVVGGTGVRWSFRWDIGRSRLVVIDSRCARVVAPDGRRQMVDDAEWHWVRAQVDNDSEIDHLLLATSVPYLLNPGIHWIEAASEPLAAGRRGRWVAGLAEKVRQHVDLEHWPAFGASFDAMTDLLRAVAAGEHGAVPASVTVLSGDVHHAYLAKAELPGAQCPVYQAVCSPLRNPLGPMIRWTDRIARLRPVVAVACWLALLAGARRPVLRWRVTHGPWFDSQIATIDIDGPVNRFQLEKTKPDGTPEGLHRVLSLDLTAPNKIVS
jgi:hypothetical protein